VWHFVSDNFGVVASFAVIRIGKMTERSTSLGFPWVDGIGTLGVSTFVEADGTGLVHLFVDATNNPPAEAVGDVTGDPSLFRLAWLDAEEPVVFPDGHFEEFGNGNSEAVS
jgi:hypothetical protein